MRARYHLAITVARLLLRLPTTATVLAAAGLMVWVAAAGLMVWVAAAATGEAAQQRTGVDDV